MKAVVLGLALALGFIGYAEAQAAYSQRQISELCAPRQYWTRDAARACIIAAYGQGARQGMW